jgi:hypothetical protein
MGEEKMREETLLEKVAIGIMMALVFVLMAWVPDFTLTEEECANQPPSAYTKGLCSEPQAK